MSEEAAAGDTARYVVMEPPCSCDEECRGGVEVLKGIPFCEDCHLERKGSLPSPEGQYIVVPKGSSTENIALPKEGVSCEPLVYGVIKSNNATTIVMCHCCGEFMDATGRTLAGRPICEACCALTGLET